LSEDDRELFEGEALSPRLLTIADELRSLDLPHREGVYLVGGTVRDILLGRQGFDIDIAVEGDAIAFAESLAGAGGEVTGHGRFGTAVVRFRDGRHWDVVTARRETYAEPAALPDVEAGTIEDDLARRDFTVNAIAASLGDDFGRLLDPHGGRDDLEKGTIRVLHDRSFVDDPTRIFRAIRYENRLGFGMDAETEQLAREGMKGVALLSAARVREEVVALLSEDGIAHTLERLAEFGGAPSVDIGLVERLDALRDELDPGAPLWRLRLAVVAAEHAGLVERLSLRREDARAVEDAVALAPALAEASDPVEIADLAGRAPDAALLALARGDSAVLRDWFTRLRDVRLEVTGNDLAELGLPESPRVGEVLEELRRRKLRGELEGREAELAAARELISQDDRQGKDSFCP
jgi:tRNA nucleotidyltransferase (CCA-adding enzyme)